MRVSLDFTGEKVDRLAMVQCAQCGRTWRRCKVPPITSAAGYQTVRLTLILPRSARRWFARGRWHREGDDATVIRDATIGDVDEAARAHGIRESRILARRERAAIKAVEAEREARERAAHLMAMLAERDAEEAAAAARDAA